MVLSGDHVYKMDYARMLRLHRERKAAVTLATIEAPIADASRFGIIAVDETERVTGFQEKPTQPTAIPAPPILRWPGMGVYIRHGRAGARARGRRQPAHQPRLRQGHHRPDSRGAGLPYRFYDENKKAQYRATSARSTRISRRT